MNAASPFIRSHLLLMLFTVMLIGLVGCATPVSQKPANIGSGDIDKNELAMRLQNCISFIDAAYTQAKSGHEKSAQEMLDKAQDLSLEAKDDFTHKRYKKSFNKVNEAYRLGFNALALLRRDLPATTEQQQQQLQQKTKSRLQVNETYINAVKRTLGYTSTEAAIADFNVAKKDYEQALNDYSTARYQEATQHANRSTDKLILILTALEYIEHGKPQKSRYKDQSTNKDKKGP